MKKEEIDLVEGVMKQITEEMISDLQLKVQAAQLEVDIVGNNIVLELNKKILETIKKDDLNKCFIYSDLLDRVAKTPDDEKLSLVMKVLQLRRG